MASRVEVKVGRTVVPLPARTFEELVQSAHETIGAGYLTDATNMRISSLDIPITEAQQPITFHYPPGPFGWLAWWWPFSLLYHKSASGRDGDAPRDEQDLAQLASMPTSLRRTRSTSALLRQMQAGSSQQAGSSSQQQRQAGASSGQRTATDAVEVLSSPTAHSLLLPACKQQELDEVWADTVAFLESSGYGSEELARMHHITGSQWAKAFLSGLESAAHEQGMQHAEAE